MKPHRESSFRQGRLSALDAIFMRRSIRACAPDRLDEETVGSLLDAAVQAPTAMHTELWASVVVQDRATLKRLSVVGTRRKFCPVLRKVYSKFIW
jgi:nitroreductase